MYAQIQNLRMIFINQNHSSPRYRLIQAILINNQDLIRRDQEAIPKENSQATEESGAFIRGAAYYGGGDPDAE